MARDGSGIYSIPPGTEGIPDTTIESTKYNNYVHDVETDLNAPRPIVAGGTGATSATDALFNLSGEKAAQVVTSYDSHIWVPGSFRSAAAAAGAPNATSAFAGTCYIGEALANPPTNQNVVVEARDMDSPVKPGLLYTKQKTGGVWSAWNYAGTGDDQTAARAAIYAAPFDAMAYNGMQINGSMEVSQERGFSNPSTTDPDICDGWIWSVGGGIVLKGTVLNTNNLSGFKNWLETEVVTPKAVVGGDFAIVIHRVEGYRMSRLGWGTADARPITLAFWTCHHRTGIYSGTIRNPSAYTRVIAFNYTQNASDVWEYKTVTLPGDTVGVWEAFNLTGMEISFAIGVGPTLTAPSANNWLAGVYLAGPGQVNAVATASDDRFRLTGVVVLPGTQVPTAAQSPLIMRPYDQELVTCQRYFVKETGLIMQVPAAGIMTVMHPFKIQMRATPTTVGSDITHSNTSAFSIAASTPDFATFQVTSSAASGYVLFAYTASARL